MNREQVLGFDKEFFYEDYGDSGLREIETIGIQSLAEEKDVENGLIDVMNILDLEKIKNVKKRTLKGVIEENDIDEFN